MKTPTVPHRQAGLRGVKARVLDHALLVAFGAVIWLVSIGRLAAYGFTWETFALWLASLATVARLAKSADDELRVGLSQPARELVALAVLLAVFAPLYLLFLYDFPNQVVTDEITLMIYERQNLARPVNLLGVSRYAGFPALLMIIFSRLGALLGGIELANMRFVHAAFGVLVVMLAYAFFRLQMPLGQALGTAALLGANHALLGISRLAEWANLSVVAELMALAVLLVAMRRRSVFIAALGGFLAGLSFYVYLPGRVTIVIWLLFLAASWWLRNDRRDRRLILRVAAVSAIGCLMVAAPTTILQLKDTRPGADYYKKGLLIFPEGRELQREWFRAESIAEGLRINAVHGLTAFNNQEHDRGFIYENRGHGFLDPLTGVLMWVGVLFAARELKHRDQANDGHVLALTGFVALWLTYSFISNQSPNYNRMLVVLPFVAYLAAEGLKRLADQRLLPRFRLPARLHWLRGHEWFAIGVVAIVIWNSVIYADYLRWGFTNGDVVGATARYLDARAGDPEHTLYLFADQARPYYPWGGEEQWRQWIGFFSGEDQPLDIEGPEDCSDADPPPPFTAFMSREVWEGCKVEFAARYPTFQVHFMRPDGSSLAVEVRR